MKKINNIVAGVAMLWAVASTQAQQVVKHVQGNIVKQLALGNGDALPTVSGTKNLSVGNSGEWWNISVRTSNFTSVPTNAWSVYTNTTIPTETIGNTTITRQEASQQQNTRTTNSNPDVNLSFIRKRARTDTNGDGWIDGIITTRDLPTLQTNAQPIPVNTKIRLTSPTLKDSSDWSTLLPTNALRYNRDGSNRVEMTVRPDGSTPPVLEDRWKYLGTEEFNTLSEAVVYPNPTSGPVTIQTDNFNDKKAEIYNLSGQVVARMPLSGDTGTIDISSLPTGPYILTTEDTEGVKTLNKIIKK